MANLRRSLFFADRRDAGIRLAKALARYDSEDAVVYALPRGGVSVAVEVARQLELPLSLLVVRKIGHPENEEYAVCAVTEDGERVCNDEEAAALDPAWLEAATARAYEEARRQRGAYGGERTPATGRIAIVVDDGIATGLTMRAATQALRRELPIELVVAAPIAPRAVVAYLRGEADNIVVLDGSEPFLGAIGAYYGSFPQVTDVDVRALLRSNTLKG